MTISSIIKPVAYSSRFDSIFISKGIVTMVFISLGKEVGGGWGEGGKGRVLPCSSYSKNSRIIIVCY